jgi:hypothetical protein
MSCYIGVAAHGGLDRFNQFKTVSASLVNGGTLWSVKRQAGVLNTHVTVDLHQEHASFALSTLPNHRAVFTPERVAVETNEGVVVAERANPRAAFAGHTLETPWDNLDRFYFSGYAMWTYLTVTFCLTWSGFEVAEIEPWQEENEIWRRLAVTFPPYLASHNKQQTFFFGADGLRGICMTCPNAWISRCGIESRSLNYAAFFHFHISLRLGILGESSVLLSFIEQTRRYGWYQTVLLHHGGRERPG